MDTLGHDRFPLTLPLGQPSANEEPTATLVDVRAFDDPFASIPRQSADRPESSPAAGRQSRRSPLRRSMRVLVPDDAEPTGLSNRNQVKVCVCVSECMRKSERHRAERLAPTAFIEPLIEHGIASRDLRQDEFVQFTRRQVHLYQSY
jgi:hypothetical protein